MAVVSMSYLLESGVHFGHQTKRWDPKMKEYIYTSRDDIYIIDLQKTAKKIEEAYVALKQIAAEGGKVIFVGTRKQAAEACRDEAIRSNSFYVTERWLGGTLTNFKTIRRRVKRMEEIERMEQDGTFNLLPKKEVSGLKKEHAKLNTLLCGIREMHKLPQAMFIVDPSKEIIAIREARKLNIPVFGIVDTNCNPDVVDYVIPANDDAIRAVKLISSVMANAICEANGGEVIDYVSERKEDATEVMQKALETVKRKEDRNHGRRNFDRRERPNFERRNYDRKPFEKRENNVAPREVKPAFNNSAKPVNNTTEKTVVNEPVKAVVKEETVDFSKKTVAELKDIAKAKNIEITSTMKKADILTALKGE